MSCFSEGKKLVTFKVFLSSKIKKLYKELKEEPVVKIYGSLYNNWNAKLAELQERLELCIVYLVIL